MGADIHSFAEVKRRGKWERVEEKIFPYYPEETNQPFEVRNYSVYGFLANVRNYSESEYLSDCRGLPTDSEYLNEILNTDWFSGAPQTRRENIIHSDFFGHGFVYLNEFLEFDYNKEFINKRSNANEKVSYEDFLGEGYFSTLDVLKTLHEDPTKVRVVFWFDQ